jgi:hypothetical protein
LYTGVGDALILTGLTGWGLRTIRNTLLVHALFVILADFVILAGFPGIVGFADLNALATNLQSIRSTGAGTIWGADFTTIGNTDRL